MESVHGRMDVEAFPFSSGVQKEALVYTPRIVIGSHIGHLGIRLRGQWAHLLGHISYGHISPWAHLAWVHPTWTEIH